MQERKPNVLVIGNPSKHPSTKAFLEKFVNILKEISNKVYVISGDKPPNYENIVWIKLEVKGNLIFIKSQLKLLKILLLNNKFKLDHEIVVVLPTPFILPVIFQRVTRKKVAVFVAQIPRNVILKIFSRLNFIFSNLLIVESKNVIKDWKIMNYKRKIIIGSIYVDTEFFKKEKEIWEREKVVGYIGNLEERKGVKELIEAISIINKKHQDIKFIIGGVGSLEKLVKDFSSRNVNVKFMGFIPKRDLPRYYNSMRLLVLPSYSEGLPNVILEAMACGTPVLATPVGAIPDIIKDEETGFIMEDNSPECIAKNVLRAIEHPNLEKIAKNALLLIQNKFTYKVAIKRYKEILKYLEKI